MDLSNLVKDIKEVIKKYNIEKTTEQKSSPGYSSRTAKKLKTKSTVLNKETVKSSSDVTGPETGIEKTVKDPLKQGSLEEANKLKRVLYGETPSKEYGEFADNPILKTALSIKEEIENKLPNFPVKETNLDIGLGSEAKRLMNKRSIQEAQKPAFNLMDYFIGGAGIGKSKPVEAASLIALRKGLNSTKSKTGLANLLYQIAKQSGLIGRVSTATLTNRQSKEK